MKKYILNLVVSFVWIFLMLILVAILPVVVGDMIGIAVGSDSINTFRVVTGIVMGILSIVVLVKLWR